MALEFAHARGVVHRDINGEHHLRIGRARAGDGLRAVAGHGRISEHDEAFGRREGHGLPLTHAGDGAVCRGQRRGNAVDGADVFSLGVVMSRC